MISEILTEIPKELLDNKFENDVVAPSFVELDKLAEVDGIYKRVVIVRDKNTIEACAICNIEIRRHHGIVLRVYSLFGYLLHDYCRLYCTSEAAMKELIKAVIKDARINKCDLIFWSNIPKELVPSDTLPIHSDIKIFTASKSDQGWSRFYKSKHVKYSINRAKKINNDYHVEIIDGYVQDHLMEDLAKMHAYRWQFAGSLSPFLTNPHRKDEYRVHPSNKHYLRIFSGNELIACHYGMKYGDTLLFHTPIINPKYLDLSPMKLILAETARYCENNGIDSIDFGHGDEAYKDGYCTLPRYTCNFIRYLTLKSHLSYLIGLLPKSQAFSLLQKIKRVGLKLKKRNKRFDKNQDVLIRDCETDYPDLTPIVCHNWMEFCDYARAYELQVYKWQYNRFHDNRSISYWAIMSGNECKASAWGNSSEHHEERQLSDENKSISLLDVDYVSQDDLNALFSFIKSASSSDRVIIGSKI